MCIQPAIVQGFLGAADSAGQLEELGVMGFSKFASHSPAPSEGGIL